MPRESSRRWNVLLWTGLAIAMWGAIGCSPSAPSGQDGRLGDAGSRGGSDGGSADERITICLLPKIKGIPYFTSCADGAKEAANELGNIELIYDGPTDGDPTKQAEMIEQWTAEQVDVICVAPNAPNVVAAAMREAMEAGVDVITWDADGVTDARSYFVNQATPQSIGQGMVNTMVSELGPETSGDVVIISSDATSDNQNEWIAVMKPALEQTRLRLATIKYPGENATNALADGKDVIKKYPNLKGIFGISSVAFPAVAEAVEQMERGGEISVVGLCTPNEMRKYVTRGTVKSVVLWNTIDLGYLTIYVANGLARGTLSREMEVIDVGRLGSKTIEGDNVLLGAPLIFTKENIDEYDF